MIVDQLDNAAFYHGLGSRFVTALNYLQQTDLASLPDGKVNVQGEDVLAMVQSYDSRLATPQTQWESHRKFVDIQYIVQGDEKMGYCRLDELDITLPFDADKDVMLFKAKADTHYDFVRVGAGMFTIFAPQDAHLPGMAIDQPVPVKKVVMKISL